MNDVLFVCVHNAGRSQMAEALFNRMAAERRLSLTAESAGTEPAGSVHENVAEAMREIGIDLPQARPELIGDAIVEQAGRVITMGCAVDAEACPAGHAEGRRGLGDTRPCGPDCRGGPGHTGRDRQEGRKADRVADESSVIRNPARFFVAPRTGLLRTTK